LINRDTGGQGRRGDWPTLDKRLPKAIKLAWICFNLRRSCHWNYERVAVQAGVTRASIFNTHGRFCMPRCSVSEASTAAVEDTSKIDVYLRRHSPRRLNIHPGPWSTRDIRSTDVLSEGVGPRQCASRPRLRYKGAVQCTTFQPDMTTLVPVYCIFSPRAYE